MNRRRFLAAGAPIAAVGTAAWYTATQTAVGQRTVGAWWQKEPVRPSPDSQRPARTRDGLAIYFDNAHDLIVHQDGNGGDTAQREGMYWLAKWFYTNRPLSSGGKPAATLAEFQA